MAALDIDRVLVEVPRETTWWGSKCTCDPRFVEQVLGNGEVLLGLQPLNTRPNYYAIRVDSSWHLSGCGCDGDCPGELADHIDEIYDAIEDEYGERDRIRYSNENELEPGQEPVSEDWPVLDLDCGSAWFVINHQKYLRVAAKRKRRERRAGR